MKIDKKKLYEDLETNFPSSLYSVETNCLAREVIKISEEWLEQNSNTSGKTKRELRKDLKMYVMERIDLKDSSKSYYSASFIWIWIAVQIISWIVFYIINKYTKSSGN